eukprot:m.24656 g.24656  ORF g.24656 m.24656 type:complete len:250 (+) comp11235_c0_seq1:35-784(+)
MTFRGVLAASRLASQASTLSTVSPRVPSLALRGTAGAARAVHARCGLSTWKSLFTGADKQQQQQQQGQQGQQQQGQQQEGAEKPVSEGGAPDERDAKISELSKQLAEMQDRNVRLLAEAENVRHRAQTDVKNAKEFGIQKFSKDLLEVADILQMAVSSVPQTELANNEPLKGLYEGLVSTQKVLHSIFERNGLAKMNTIGEKFDPNHHEAQFQMEDPTKAPNTVSVEVRSGYLLNNRVVRAALVGVVKE